MYDATRFLRIYARRRLRHLAHMDPNETQRRVLSSLIRRALRTKFGRDHEFSESWSLDDFRSRVPLRGLRRLLGRLLARGVPAPDRLHLAGTRSVVRRVVRHDDRRHEIHPRQPGNAPVQCARRHRTDGPPYCQPAGKPAAGGPCLHARRLDRARAPRAGGFQRRFERHCGGGNAPLGQAALLPAARPGEHRRLGGEDRPLCGALPGCGDFGRGRHAELAADLLRAPGRDRPRRTGRFVGPGSPTSGPRWKC